MCAQEAVMTALELIVNRTQAGRTVKSLLKRELCLSTALTNRLKRTETGLTVNGTRVFTNAVLHEGDVLTVDLDAAERSSSLMPVPMNLDVAYEDDHLMVVNKPAPLDTIPSSLVPGAPSLAAGLLYYLGDGASIHLVNRLDKGTTGLIMAAKNAYIHDRLRRQLHTTDFHRTYLAVCVGAPEKLEGRIELPIGRAPDSAVRRQINQDGKPAVTDYCVLKQTRKFSLVELTPLTGRTHQLRVHMAALGCPLAGDWLYGREDRELIPRPALHATRLTLTHPVTGKQLALVSPLPADMKILLEREN